MICSLSSWWRCLLEQNTHLVQEARKISSNYPDINCFLTDYELYNLLKWVINNKQHANDVNRQSKLFNLIEKIACDGISNGDFSSEQQQENTLTNIGDYFRNIIGSLDELVEVLQTSPIKGYYIFTSTASREKIFNILVEYKLNNRILGFIDGREELYNSGILGNRALSYNDCKKGNDTLLIVDPVRLRSTPDIFTDYPAENVLLIVGELYSNI